MSNSMIVGMNRNLNVGTLKSKGWDVRSLKCLVCRLGAAEILMVECRPSPSCLTGGVSGRLSAASRSIEITAPAATRGASQDGHPTQSVQVLMHRVL